MGRPPDQILKHCGPGNVRVQTAKLQSDGCCLFDNRLQTTVALILSQQHCRDAPATLSFALQ
jgi:hypothetical protein